MEVAVSAEVRGRAGMGLSLGRGRGSGQCAGFDVVADAMGQASLGSGPVHSPHGDIESELRSTDEDTGQTGAMGFEESGHGSVVDSPLLVESPHGSAIAIVDARRMDRRNGFTRLQGIKIPLKVFATSDFFVEGASLPGAAKVEAVRVAGAKSKPASKVVPLKQCDATAQRRIEFTEDRSDRSRHRLGKAPDGLAV